MNIRQGGAWQSYTFNAFIQNKCFCHAIATIQTTYHPVKLCRFFNIIIKSPYTPLYTGLKETKQRESLNETWDNKHNLKHNKDGTYCSDKNMIYFYFIFSVTLRHHLWSRNHHHTADDKCHCQVPWHAQQCPGVHEASRGEKISLVWFIHLHIFTNLFR